MTSGSTGALIAEGAYYVTRRNQLICEVLGRIEDCRPRRPHMKY